MTERVVVPEKLLEKLTQKAKYLYELNNEDTDPCKSCSSSESYKRQYCCSCKKNYRNLPRKQWVSLVDVEAFLVQLFRDNRLASPRQLSGHVRIVCAANPSFDYCEHCYQTERTECPTGKLLFGETVEDKSFVVVSRKEIENFPYLKCQKVKLEDADDYCSNEECKNYRSCNWFWTVFKKELLEVSGVGKTHFYTVSEAREKLKEVSGEPQK